MCEFPLEISTVQMCLEVIELLLFHISLKTLPSQEGDRCSSDPCSQLYTALQGLSGAALRCYNKNRPHLNSIVFLEGVQSLTVRVQSSESCSSTCSNTVTNDLDLGEQSCDGREIFAELHRITDVNLHNQFYTELDRHTPRLISLFRAVALREILGTYDLQSVFKIDFAISTTFKCSDEESDVSVRRTMALHALPVYLREDDSGFFKTYSQEEEPDVTDIPVALLVAGADPFSSKSFFVVVEGNIVVSDLPAMPDALLVLFGLIYTFNLQYPKKLLHTFTFIQKIVVCLDDGKPLNQSLKPT
ncbi:uncharacterized protein [Hoplias malabaricus]|uniref:uncharacterized protein n=1 Tax=Hoplias malabaricus TaxID=27720 RepID=UPI003462E254